MHAAGIAASALLLGLYARLDAGWLGLMLLVPWLLSLARLQRLPAVLISAWLMSIGMVLTVFGWFASALASFAGVHLALAWLLLALLAPLLQPQLLFYATARHLAARRLAAAGVGLVGACSWVASEWLLPRLFNDTLGHGLAEAVWWRQAADLIGASGLSLLLILSNEALALAATRWRAGWRRWMPPLCAAALAPVLLGSYGVWRIAQLTEHWSQPAAGLRIGMVQSAIVDYEGLRRELGSYQTVRMVLDAHFELSRAALDEYGVDALLWSETVYPTPFGHPRSEDGAALDREIQAFVDELAVPLVFGSYDVDPHGEYNAAVFLEPGAGLLGYYRKTHPFPLTETVPGWLEGPLLRQWLPWAGSWKAGDGVRVLPLRTRDGRSLDVVPLICLDSVDPMLAIEGARLGAQAIIALSNDSWFSADPLGAALHLRVAAFRSIETRLPQLRVTSNGLSAFIDPSGEVLARSGMGDRAVLAGEVPIQAPPPTLMRSLGDWVGPAALVALIGIVVLLGLRERLSSKGSRSASDKVEQPNAQNWTLILYTPANGSMVLALRLLAGAGLFSLAAGMAFRYGPQVNHLTQVQTYLWTVLAPLLGAWLLARRHSGEASIAQGQLRLRVPGREWQLPTARIAALHAWRLPLPAYPQGGMGLWLLLQSGRRFDRALIIADALGFWRSLRAAGSPLPELDSRTQFWATFFNSRFAARQHWLDHGAVRFGLFPLLLALPAFRLHQIIAYGGTFGEWQVHGAAAWFTGLLIWWAAWGIGLMLYAALLRIGIEGLALLAALLAPQQLAVGRAWLETGGRLLYYLAAPAALLLKLIA